MWEEIFDRVQYERDLRRQESVSTVSTVETFVSQPPSQPVEHQPKANLDAEVGEKKASNANITNVPRWKIFMWNYSEKLVKITMILSFILGISCLIPGYVCLIVALQILGIIFIIIGVALLMMKLVVHFTSKEQREAPLPYTGFNTFTPGVSWGKVFAKQREN